MTPIQKILYDSLRALGLAYLSTDRDGAVNMINRNNQHTLCLYPSGQLYEIRAGKYLNVTFR
jgi:hypothetical protein